MSAQDDVNLYLDTVLGTGEAFLHTLTGVDPHHDEESGRVAHRRVIPKHYRWPAQRRQAVADILSASEDSDAWVCPYPMVADKRAAGAAAARLIVKADVDGGLFDADKVRAVNGWAVASGSPGNAHVYISLTESIPSHWHESLSRGLMTYLGAADAKIQDNDVLRPPGTLNHKSRARGGEPTEVHWLIKPADTRWDAESLAEVLGVTLPQSSAGSTSRAKASGAPGEKVDLDLYPALQAALAVNTGDRSADTMRVVGACVSAKLTLAQARWAVNTRTDLAERLAGRRDDDVQECWLRAVDSRQDYARRRTTTTVSGDQISAEEKVIHSGHLGMAYKMGEQFRDKLLYVNGIGWHRWDGKRWARDANGAARRAVHTVIKREWIACANLPAEERDERAKQISRYESASAISGILTEAAALEVFSVTVNDLDADPYLLNVANGTLDLHTLQLRPASPADRITKVCRGAYHPGAQAPVFEAFLKRSLPDEQVRKFVQRLAGLALLGEVREHLLPIFTGEGANGKSTFYEAVLYDLGDYGCVAEPELFTHRENAHPTGQMDLMGRRLAVVSETDEGKRLAEATMKRLTGGDPITARYMRENNVTFTPSHLPILVTNHLPKVSGDSPSVWRRIRVIDWTVVIPAEEQDKQLPRKLQLEADGILAWCVEGLRDYLAGGLAEPDSVTRSTSKYRADSDAVARFISEECHQSEAVKITAGDLFDAWEQWRRIDGAAEISKRALGQALDRKGFTAKDSNGKRWWLGICVLKEDKQ